jgi:hypothetical protein
MPSAAQNALSDLRLLLGSPGAGLIATIQRELEHKDQVIATQQAALQRISQHAGEPLAQAVARCALLDAEEGRKP